MMLAAFLLPMCEQFSNFYVIHFHGNMVVRFKCF